MSEINWAAFAPVLLLLFAFVVWCWVDMSKHDVRYLPRWLWAIIVAISIPLGGIAYLLFGRESAPIR